MIFIVHLNLSWLVESLSGSIRWPVSAENGTSTHHYSIGNMLTMTGRMLIPLPIRGRIESTGSILSPFSSLSATILVNHLLSMVQYWSLMCFTSTFAGSLNKVMITISMNTVRSFMEEWEKDAIRLKSCVFMQDGTGAALCKSLLCHSSMPGAWVFKYSRSV